MKFFKSFLPGLMFFAAVCFFSNSSYSQTNTWIGGSGNWNTGSNWSLGVPTAAHDVVINTGVSISVNVNATINSLTITGPAFVQFTSSGGARTITIDNTGSSISAGSTLLLNGSTGSGTRTMGIAFTGSNRTMSIAGRLILTTTGEGSIYDATNSLTTVTGTGTLQVQGTGTAVTTITSTTSNLNFQSGGIYNHALNGRTIPAATWDANSNCNITGVTDTAPTGLTQAFGNFTWSCASQSGGAYLIEALTTVNGNFTVDNTSTNIYGLYLAETNNSNYTLNIGGNLIINNNAWLVMVYGQTNGSFGDNVTATVNVGGNFSMTGANSFFDYWPFHATGGSLSLNKLVLNVAGNYSQSGGAFDFAGGNSDVSNFTELQLGGNMSLTGTGIILTSTADNQITDGTITFNKSGTQTVYAETPANLAYTNFIVAANSTTQLLSNIVLYSSATAVWAGNFTVNNNGILDAGTFQLESSTGVTPGSNNSFTLSAGGGLITANVNGVENTTIGTVSTSLASRTYSSAANYTYNGTAVQNSGIFTTTPAANQVNNLTMNNTAGNTTSGMTLEQPMTVAGILTLTSGHITTDNTNLLIMDAGSSVSGQNYAARNPGGSANSFVNGPLRKTGNTNFLFPVGKVNRGIRFCGISSPANPGDAFTAEFISGSASNMSGGITASGLSHVSKCEYWNINRTTGSSTVDVILSWNPSSLCNAAAYVTQMASLVVAHYGTSWDNYGGLFDAGSSVSSGSITWSGVSTFSPFSLGSTNGAENPLPVKLVDVKAYNTGSSNKIEWTNLTEIDVIAYEVERSLNGTQFAPMATLAARSNSNDKESYYEYDVQPASVTYYRIKVTSRDGKIVYSPIVKVATNLTVKQDIVLYPNPVTGKQFTIQMSGAAGDYFVKVFSSNGQIVKTEILKHPGGSFSKSIELPGQLQAGQYYLQVSGGEKILTSKFIVQ